MKQILLTLVVCALVLVSGIAAAKAEKVTLTYDWNTDQIKSRIPSVAKPAAQTVEAGENNIFTVEMPEGFLTWIITLSEDDKTQYRFLGWARCKNDSKPDYTEKTAVTATNNLKLYGVWEIMKDPGFHSNPDMTSQNPPSSFEDDNYDNNSNYDNYDNSSQVAQIDFPSQYGGYPNPQYGVNNGQMVFNRIFDERSSFPGARPCMPPTGFPTLVDFQLRVQPDTIHYENLGINIKIPRLDVDVDVVGVPELDDSWGIDWLQDRAGLLIGSETPGQGYSVVAAHSHLSRSLNGPFALISDSKEGDMVLISETDGSLVRYAVYANELLKPDDIETLTEIALRQENTLVLITCEDESSDGGYLHRRAIFASPMA